MEQANSAYKVDFLRPEGEPSLVPPDSPQWRVINNTISLGIGGIAAVLLEFADARIRSGVWDHSVFKTDPLGRSQRTATANLAGVFGPASAARRLIAGVNRMHAKVVGETPSGETYRATEPELLDWVSATAGYCFLESYHRFVRPVSAADRLRYYEDGKDVARLYGVRQPLGSDADFFAMLDRLSPRFESHQINIDFLNIVQSRQQSKVKRFLSRAMVRAAVSLLPPKVRASLALGKEYDLTLLDSLVIRTLARLVDRIRSRKSPAWKAAVRLGLPGNFIWLSPSRKRAILASKPKFEQWDVRDDSPVGEQSA